MKKRKQQLRMISLLLTLVLFVQTLSFPVYSTEETGSLTETTQGSTTEDNAETESISSEEFEAETSPNDEPAHDAPVSEVIARREENVKHFDLGSGQYQAVSYAAPVHRKDASGKWQDIDNRLFSVDDRSTAYATSDGRTTLAATATSSEIPLMSLNENGYTLSMTPVVDASHLITGNMNSDTTIEIQNHSVKTAEELETLTVANMAEVTNTTTAIYRNVFPATDLEYVLTGNDIKENIIVKSPQSTYEYAFILRLTGLVPQLEASGRIVLLDAETEAPVYEMPAPYMYDADGNVSYDVHYELSGDKGVYGIRVIANAAWINATTRTFPVTIDPSISAGTFLDAYTNSASPNQNYGYEEELWVSNTRTSYIYPYLPTLPTGATFNSAYLYVNYYYNITTGSLLAGAYQVSENWEEGTITHNNAPDVSATCLSTATLAASTSISESTPGTAYFNITNAASDWYEDSSTAFGIAIKRETSTSSTNASVILKSFESGDDCAYVTVNYTHYIPDGVYALQNGARSSSWMTVEDDSIWPGKHIQRLGSTTSPTDSFDRSSLFKISRVNGTNRYIIRSMLNNCLTFDISGTEVITKEIPSADADVAVADTFFLEWDGVGFYIQPYDSDYCIMLERTSETDITTVERENAGATARWKLIQYTGVHRRGHVLTFPSVRHAGTTVTVTPYVWSTHIDYNTPHVSVAPGCTDLATATWNESTQNASVVLHDEGSLQLSVKIYNAAQTAYYTSSHTLTLTLLVEEGVYFIQNKEVGYYMQIDDGDEPNYNTSGSIMELWNLDGEDYQRWNLIHVRDGYYKIISENSGLALCIASASVNADDAKVVQEAYSDVSRKKWKITTSASGAYVFRPQSGESYATDWCMCANDPLVGGNDGLDVEQKAYNSDTDYRDEWVLTRILPTNGYEIAYNPTAWNNTVALWNSNCYNYALNRLNLENDGIYCLMQPGGLAECDVYNYIDAGTYDGYPALYCPLKDGEQIQSYAIADAEYLDITFTPIGQTDVCPDGTYKVALVVDLLDDPQVPEEYWLQNGVMYIYPDMDYHWYRQNPDGTWSHKRGQSEVINYDASGEIIYDPQVCDRDYGTIDYSIFVGYYAVSSVD